MILDDINNVKADIYNRHKNLFHCEIVWKENVYRSYKTIA